MSWKPTASDIAWTRQHLDGINDGGVWAIPKNRSIWRIDKTLRTLTCIHGDKDEMYHAVAAACAAVGYTAAHTTEKLTPEQVQKEMDAVVFGQVGSGKSLEITNHKEPEKKFVWRLIDASDLAKYRVNLAGIPKHMRWKGRGEPQCDFCADSTPIITYAASEMTDGTKCDCWRWLACSACHSAITLNDFELLEKRSAKVFGRGMDGKTALFAVKLALMKFHKHAIPQ